ncbi:MAG: hypothetical protein EOP06_06735 [Proteobacteria bacterium]|nr:MAG: hypothetical protein EOP06_06735 [Pseudomonadota bacterium]
MIGYLLDENISPVVADQVVAKNAAITVHSVLRWRDETLVGRADVRVLRAATETELTLVTYDLKTIPPLLMEITSDGESHAGVLFVDDAFIRNNDFGRLVAALLAHFERYGQEDWINRVAFLTASLG